MRSNADRLLACMLALFAATPGAVLAERADRDKPVHIEADSVRMDDLQKTAVYEGKVVLTQGTLRVEAERIDVRQDETGLLSGTAVGRPVHFRQKMEGRDEWVEGWGNRVEYDARKEQVRLIGQAYLKKGEEELRGDLISYDARSEFYQASGSLPGQKPGRVRAVILPPKENKQTGGKKDGAGRQDPANAPLSAQP